MLTRFIDRIWVSPPALPSVTGAIAQSEVQQVEVTFCWGQNTFSQLCSYIHPSPTNSKGILMMSLVLFSPHRMKATAMEAGLSRLCCCDETLMKATERRVYSGNTFHPGRGREQEMGPGYTSALLPGSVSSQIACPKARALSLPNAAVL